MPSDPPPRLYEAPRGDRVPARALTLLDPLAGCLLALPLVVKLLGPRRLEACARLPAVCVRVGGWVAPLLQSLAAGAAALVGLAAVLAAVVLALSLDLQVAWSWYAQLEALTFPSTPGVITRNTGEWCDRELEYDYAVHGVAFHGSGLRRDHIRLMPDDDERVKGYSVGKHVPVYYKPSSPEVSLLEPGLTWQQVLEGTPAVTLVNAMVLGPLIYGLWQIVRRRRSGSSGRD
jgi:hypothetical protein